MRLKHLFAEVWILISLFISLLGAQEMFPVGNFEKLRRQNCTNCTDRVSPNGAHLPRLTLIKQRILQALGREDTKGPERKQNPPTYVPKAFIAPKQTTPPSTRHIDEEGDESSGVNDIVIFSETIGSENGNAVINFKYHSHGSSTDIEPVGASLLLHIHRRRKIRKGGKGKKIVLSVTDHDEKSKSNEILTYLRTRVKKSRWKKLSLPLSVAQKFLNSGDRGLSLRVNCAGCGRLVQLVFSNSNTSHKSQQRRRKRKEMVDGNQRKRRKSHRNRQRRNISTRPILVISTRRNHS